MFRRLRRLVEELHQAPDVRYVQKCGHAQGPHACFEQTWWKYSLEEQPEESEQGSEDILQEPELEVESAWTRN